MTPPRPTALQRGWSMRPLRERVLLTVCAAAVVALAADAVLLRPLERGLRAAELERARLLEREQAAQTDRRSALARQVEERDRERALRGRIEAARERLRQRGVDEQPGEQEVARLPEVLRAIVATVGTARLVELQFTADGDAAGNAAAPNGAAARTASSGAADDGGPAPVPVAARRAFRLPVTLTVAGRWDELQTVLAQVERHAAVLRWSTLTLDSTDWPSIQLTLKAHVPSPQPRWGGAS